MRRRDDLPEPERVHEMIVASAGSGKTYQLTHRILQLLAWGESPERIVALTFTKKAAGEFLDTVLNKLAAAAGNAASAQGMATELGRPGLTPGDFQRMLESVVQRLHLLHFGTLDAFFHRVIRNFPFELGLSGDFEVLDDHRARLEQRRVYRHLFQEGNPLPGGSGSLPFLEAFKEATWGTEDRKLVAKLDRFIAQHHRIFLGVPEPEAWGNRDRIWSEGTRWLDRPTSHALEADLKALEDLVHSKPISQKQRERWQRFVDEVREWSPGEPYTSGIEFLLKKALEDWEALSRRNAVWTVHYRKEELTEEQCRLMERIIRHLVGGMIEARLRQTQGLYAMLRLYDSVYDRLVRRQGRLSFDDVLLLLNGSAASEGASPLVLTQQAEGEDRLPIAYRLDCQLDHWLLDEFQDTSHPQWRVLAPLIDEVIQDPSGRRSFFYVGDIKQAIFGWRGGEPRLFYEIFRYYNQGHEPAIRHRSLSESWRSGPAVIDLVNRVFGDMAALRTLFPSEAVDQWQQAWAAHDSNRPDLPGYAAWLEVEKNEDPTTIVPDWVEAIRPHERGLSCAILVRENKTAQEIVASLRGRGLPATSESDVYIARDNPMAAGLLSLFKAAAYPADRFAWEHIRMTPLGRWIESREWPREDLVRSVLIDLHRDGFEAGVDRWVRWLEEEVGLDPFSRQRGRELVTAAHFFDETGGGSVADFLDYLEHYTVKESEPGQMIRVMTIHKAKGLGFDCVVLPDLKTDRLAQRRDGLGVHRTAEREVSWVLDLPPKAICENDPVLETHLSAAEAEGCFENLCNLYVAMTRARQGLYLMTSKPGSSESINCIRLLKATLGADGASEARAIALGAREVDCVFETGDPSWYEATSPPSEPSALEPSLPRLRGPMPKMGSPPRGRRRSSEQVEFAIPGEKLFAFEEGEPRRFGTLVHQVFEAIEWADDHLDAMLEQRRREAASDQVLATAIDEVRACLQVAVIRQAFHRPDPQAEVWREKPFEVVLDGEWVSGAFDRVTLNRSTDQQFTHAVIIDFKTDRIGEDRNLTSISRTYAPQLRSYRRVLQRLTGLPETRIRCQLLFTQLRKLVEIENRSHPMTNP